MGIRWWPWGGGGGGGGGQGLALIFIPAEGRGLHPGPPTPLPWTPSPPPPSTQVHLKTWVLGTFFGHGEKFFSAFGTCHTLCTYCSMCAPYTLFSRLPCPNTISAPRSHRCHEGVIDALLYFRCKDRITGHKRQKAYNEAQKACATLVLCVPMATLCKFVAVTQKMATRDHNVRCMLHEFHAMQATVCTRWAAQASLILTDKKDHCHLA